MYKSSSLSILLVEDETDTRQILSSVIVKKYPDYKVHTAQNGEEGLELFMRHYPQIVITDISMPLMNGIRMAANIRACSPETVIVAVTAYSDTKYLLEAIEIGINHYVLKPVDYRKFFSIIDKNIATIQLEQQVKLQSNFIRKLSRALEQSPSIVIITDQQGNIEYVNPKFTDVTGFTSQEVLGKNTRILNSGQTTLEQYTELWQTITSGKEWHGEFLNRKKNGELYWEAASISPLVNEEGAVTNYIAVKEDITLRKQSEQEIKSLNDMLASRAIEMEAANRELEAFNYTVSHDLRSPVTAILGFSQVLLEKHTEQLNEQSISCIQVIHQEVRRMDEMIKSLLKFSRLANQPMAQEKVNLSAIAATIVWELKLRHPERIVSTDIAENVFGYGDPILLRIVMENLIGNALKYTANRKTAKIEFGVMDKQGAASYYVCDNGVGFDSKHAHRLFGVFQRLHDEKDFEGHGIGLATVQRIIQRHGGTIHAEGEAGKGATFYFTLGPAVK